MLTSVLSKKALTSQAGKQFQTSSSSQAG